MAQEKASETMKARTGSENPRWKGGHSQTKDGKRNYHLQKNYGISLEEYDEMWDTQEGICASCGELETAKNPIGAIRRLSVDHDHKTGKVRGLLCSRCNQALGLLKDSPKRILGLLTYLTEIQGVDHRDV